MLAKCNELECPAGKKHGNPCECGHSLVFWFDIWCCFGQDEQHVFSILKEAERRVLARK